MPLYAVYGTLKEGHANHRILDPNRVRHWGNFVTEPKFTMYNLGGFPAVVKGGKTGIAMEVYEVLHDIVEHGLDRLEGFYGENNPHNFYDKTVIDTPFGTANMYIMNKHKPDLKGAPTIASGVWEKGIF